MQYAILCYHDENVVCSWTKEEDEAVMAKLAVVQEKLARQGKLGPVARLLPTTAATTLRKDREPPLVLDGPFAETKAQFGGYYVIEEKDLQEAVRIAARIPGAQRGCVEVRPVAEDTRTLDVHMSWLRSVIEPNPRKPRYLKTLRGQGYRLDVPG